MKESSFWHLLWLGIFLIGVAGCEAKSVIYHFHCYSRGMEIKSEFVKEGDFWATDICLGVKQL